MPGLGQLLGLGGVIVVGDHVVAVARDLVPVQRRAVEAGDVPGLAPRLDRAQQGLGGDAGPERALAADELGLHRRDLLARLGEPARGVLAAGPRPDHDGVESLLRAHGAQPSRAERAGPRGTPPCGPGRARAPPCRARELGGHRRGRRRARARLAAAHSSPPTSSSVSITGLAFTRPARRDRSA